MALRVTSIQCSGHLCFRQTWAGFESIEPVNVIVGKNNSGKSRMLDLVQAMCDGQYFENGRSWNLRFGCLLDPSSMEQRFPNGGQLLDPLDVRKLKNVIGKPLSWEQSAPKVLRLTADIDSWVGNALSTQEKELLRRHLSEMALQAVTPVSTKTYRFLAADRDVLPETQATSLTFSGDGRGATSLVRKHLLSAASPFDADNVEIKLLGALNQVFEPDASFIDIQVKNLDGGSIVSPETRSEIFLREEHKGFIPLSQSGSGLKTVLLVLINLILVPLTGGKDVGDYVFAFEELENNLHPSLLRRLLSYIESAAVKEGATIFLTTHSSATVDFFGRSDTAQVIRVTHDGAEAQAERVDNYFHQLKIIGDLGARPSDLLQANGILWAEGPSDRIYLNKWIELISRGELKEGRHYQCAFYGGALLSKVKFAPSEEEFLEFVNLLRLNSNAFVLCDSDRTNAQGRPKERVQRIKEELAKFETAGIWITKVREIENYLTGEVLQQYADSKRPLRDPEPYEQVVPATTSTGSKSPSYLEQHAEKKSYDKIEVALRTSPLLSLEMMEGRHDWKTEMDALVALIRRWNQ